MRLCEELRRIGPLTEIPCNGFVRRGVCEDCGAIHLRERAPAQPSPIRPRPKWIADVARDRAREALVADAVKNRGTNTSIAEG